MITGERIVLRPLEIGDESYLHRWRNDCEIMAYSDLKYGFLISREAMRRWILEQVESAALFPKEKTFLICTKSEMLPIGDVTYRNWNPVTRSAEFGIEICELDYRGMGYGHDALTVFIDFMFQHLNLNRIELNTLSSNRRAILLYEELGFEKIGVFREAAFNSEMGQYEDVIYMDILRREWMNE